MPISTPALRQSRMLGSLALAVSLVTPVSVLARDGLARVSPPAESELPSVDESSDAPEGDVTQPSEAEPPPDDTLQPTVTEVEREPAPTGGGVAGAIVDPNDPNATRAQSDLEGEKLEDNVEGVPDRLPRLQAVGWWTTFGAVALATTGGIFSGIAETRQDEAERLAYTFNLETGRATLYGDVADEYESVLRDGETYQWVSRGFIIAGGATLIAAITVFAVDGVQRRKAARSGKAARVRIDSGVGGLALRF